MRADLRERRWSRFCDQTGARTAGRSAATMQRRTHPDLAQHPGARRSRQRAALKPGTRYEEPREAVKTHGQWTPREAAPPRALDAAEAVEGHPHVLVRAPIRRLGVKKADHSRDAGRGHHHRRPAAAVELGARVTGPQVCGYTHATTHCVVDRERTLVHRRRFRRRCHLRWRAQSPCAGRRHRRDRWWRRIRVLAVLCGCGRRCRPLIMCAERANELSEVLVSHDRGYVRCLHSVDIR